jgi:hypothetical protein
LVDVSALEVRPSPWRQAVDLSNMLLTLALRSDPERVYARATRVFTPDEIAEAFASAVGLTIPTELQTKMKADGRPLLEVFRRLAPPTNGTPAGYSQPLRRNPRYKPRQMSAITASTTG